MKRVIVTAVRSVMRQIARVLDTLSGGRITPDAVTWFGFLMHLPIGYLIATGHMLWGAALLIVFGLFDTLDGELARLQKRESDRGGFLDASTDRFKEVLLYTAVAYLLARTVDPRLAAIAVAACGASICVSFVKSKGETIIASRGQKLSYPQLNRMFGGGLFSFEVRILVLIVGLVVGSLLTIDGVAWASVVVAVGAALTALQRLVVISRSIR